MDAQELNAFLEKQKERIKWLRSEDDLGAIYLKSNLWDTIIRIQLDKLPNINDTQILQQLEAGKNIVQMSRITGFFSVINNWNPGKRGELRDRYRIGKDSFKLKD